LAAKAKTKGKAKSAKRGVDQRLVKALAHELRVAILATLNERMASPNELAKELGEGLSQVSYHVKVLKDYNCIELVKTEPRRGAVEHYYRATSRAYLSDREWQELPDSVKPGLSADLLQMIVDDAVAALEESTFDDRETRHMSWTPMRLDEEGWGEVTEVLNDTLEKIFDIQGTSAKRLAKSSAKPFTASVAMLGYEVSEEATRKPLKRKAKRLAQKSARAKTS
jgi:DNA-binding transcriptional ArsR family regulator